MLKSFFQTVLSSIYDPEFYASIPERKKSSVFGFFAFIMFVAAVILSIPFLSSMARLLLQPSAEKNELIAEIQGLYPEELVLTVSGGTLSTNTDQPIIIPLPERWRHGMDNGKEQEAPKNLLVIDTKHAIKIEDFKTYDTLAIMDDRSFGYDERANGKIEIHDLSRAYASDVVIDQSKYAESVVASEKIFRIFCFIMMPVFPIVVMIGLMLLNAAYMLFGAFVVSVAARTSGVRWSYGTAYKAGIHLLIPSLAYQLLELHGLVISFPMAFTIILFIMTVINTRKPQALPEKKTDHEEETLRAASYDSAPLV